VPPIFRDPRHRTAALAAASCLLLLGALLFALVGGGNEGSPEPAGAEPSATASPSPAPTDWSAPRDPAELGGTFGLSARDAAGEPTGKRAGTAGAPKDDSLRLTVPKLEAVRNARVPTVSGSDEAALAANVGIHVRGTGFPWQEGSNVYIAGHRVGYAGTESEYAFREIDELDRGDEVLLKDARGRAYRYRVYERFEVAPNDTSVVRPVPGKTIVTLQSCTLPDYSERVIVRAEKVRA